jgi:hypothetical protein
MEIRILEVANEVDNKIKRLEERLEGIEDKEERRLIQVRRNNIIIKKAETTETRELGVHQDVLI